jgi:hypothetical protein
MAKTTPEEMLLYIIRMMGSPNEGDRIAAVNKLGPALQNLGKDKDGKDKDIYWLADQIEGKANGSSTGLVLSVEQVKQQVIDAYWQGHKDAQERQEVEKQQADGTHNADGSLTWHGKAMFCLAKIQLLNAWEQEFIQNQAAKTSDPARVPTEREQVKIRQCFIRCGGRP